MKKEFLIIGGGVLLLGGFAYLYMRIVDKKHPWKYYIDGIDPI
jgi:hypothetical protein